MSSPEQHNVHSTPQPGWEQFYQLEARVRATEERQNTTDRRLESGAQEFATLKASIDGLRQQLAGHSLTVAEVRDIIVELRELVVSFGNIKGAIRVMRIAGDVLKWGFGIGAAALGMWAAYNGLGGVL